MRNVVDTNNLQAEALRDFLRASRRNEVVVTDFLAMELYGCEDVHAIRKNLAILAEFPQQVVLTKPTHKVIRMNGRSKGLQRRLVDEEQTRGFPRFIRQVSEGGLSVEQQLLAHGAAARQNLDSLIDMAKRRRDVFHDLVGAYSKDERKALRQGIGYTEDLIGKLGHTLLEYAAEFMGGANVRLPSWEHLPNTFAFRWGACDYLQVLRRAALGDTAHAKPEGIRNDFVDMAIVAYATFFDGITSSEKTVKHMYDQARFVIGDLFKGRVRARSWTESRVAGRPPPARPHRDHRHP